MKIPKTLKTHRYYVAKNIHEAFSSWTSQEEAEACVERFRNHHPGDYKKIEGVVFVGKTKEWVMRIRKELKLKPKAGKKPTGKEKEVEHGYLFLVPNNDDGKKFYKLCKKYLDKRYELKRRGNHHDRIGLYKKIKKAKTSLMDVPIKHAEAWRFYLEVKHIKKRHSKYERPNLGILSWRLFEAIERLQSVGLRELMLELNKEFRIKSAGERTTVIKLMERLLAAYIAGQIKGEY